MDCFFSPYQRLSPCIEASKEGVERENCCNSNVCELSHACGGNVCARVKVCACVCLASEERRGVVGERGVSEGGVVGKRISNSFRTPISVGAFLRRLVR